MSGDRRDRSCIAEGTCQQQQAKPKVKVRRLTRAGGAVGRRRVPEIEPLPDLPARLACGEYPGLAESSR